MHYPACDFILHMNGANRGRPYNSKDGYAMRVLILLRGGHIWRQILRNLKLGSDIVYLEA
jgi:hypothetical protein